MIYICLRPNGNGKFDGDVFALKSKIENVSARRSSYLSQIVCVYVRSFVYLLARVSVHFS